MDKMLKDFKDFVSRGNLVELAVAFVIGVAFATLVSSFVDHVVNPIIGAIFGQPSFSSLTIDLWGDAVLRYGAFLTTLITFLSVAAVVFFFVVKPYNAWMEGRHRRKKKGPAAPSEDIALLREIRDALQR